MTGLDAKGDIPGSAGAALKGGAMAKGDEPMVLPTFPLPGPAFPGVGGACLTVVGLTFFEGLRCLAWDFSLPGETLLGESFLPSAMFISISESTDLGDPQNYVGPLASLSD